MQFLKFGKKVIQKRLLENYNIVNLRLCLKITFLWQAFTNLNSHILSHLHRKPEQTKTSIYTKFSNTLKTFLIRQEKKLIERLIILFNNEQVSI